MRERGARGLVAFTAALVIAAALVSIPALAHDTLATIYSRTVAYQADRSAPFSIWGLYGGLHTEQTIVQLFAVALAGALALLPRRADLIGLCACSAAIVIAVELGVNYWFYLYIPWFFAPAIVVLLGRYDHGVRDARWRPEEIHRRLTSQRLSQLSG
jgi:hypothetical protein